MPLHTKASAVTAALRDRLEQIHPNNGYITELARVYGPTDKVPDAGPFPYALVRPGVDGSTSWAGIQATRVRQFELEVVFSKAAEEDQLSAVHVDVLRALGVGLDQPERKFPGLVEDEEQASFRWASGGEKTHSITITLGVLYVETYN
jgi:hypothetical protein